ncbi:MAG: hypothetical protein IJ417_01450 [Bacteroidaceae bacterium]|nr:hypothetical protein [Bacteroidaceae bacterium]
MKNLVYIISLGAAALFGFSACNESRKSESKEKALVAKEEQHKPLLADFTSAEAMTTIYRGKIGSVLRASIEVIEKGATGAAVTVCMNDSLFTFHHVERNAQMRTLSYECGDTLLMLSMKQGNYGTGSLTGTLQWNRGEAHQVSMTQYLLHTSAYPIKRFEGVADKKVAASVRNLQQVIARKDRDAFADLCDWPFSFRGMPVADEQAMKKIPEEQFFNEDFISKIADSYDYFFYRDAETGWYCLGQGFLWFVVNPDGLIRVKSISHTF